MERYVSATEESAAGAPSSVGDVAGTASSDIASSGTAPFVFDVRALAQSPGAMETARRRVRAPHRIGVDLIGIEESGPLDVDVRLESVVEGILVSGTVTASASGRCARCLRDVEERVQADITALYAFAGSETDRTDDDEDVGRVVDGCVDIEQSVVDGIVLSLPLQPLCREDCPGLCPVCGVDLADAEPGHGHETMDPRWAGLVGKLDEIAGSQQAGAGDSECSGVQNTDHRDEEN